MADVVFKGTREELLSLLRQLPAALAGQDADPRLVALVNDHVLRPMGAALLGEVGEAFDEKSSGQVGRDGIAWKELSPATLRKRRAEGIEHDYILHESGAMQRSLTNPNPAGGANAPVLLPDGMPFRVFDTQPGEVTIGTTRYADHHVGFGRVPARPLWPYEGMPYWQAVVGAGVQGLMEVVTILCGRV